MTDITIENCKFGFECDMTCDALEPTSKENVRSCLRCMRAVVFCATDAELADAVKSGYCAAINRFSDETIRKTMGVVAIDIKVGD